MELYRAQEKMLAQSLEDIKRNVEMPRQRSEAQKIKKNYVAVQKRIKDIEPLIVSPCHFLKSL